MEIKKLFERDAVRTNEAQRRQKISSYQEQSSESNARSSTEDTVTISPLSRQLAQVSNIVADDEEARKKRVAEIKGQVESGTYSVDRSAVARSLISYAADMEEMG